MSGSESERTTLYAEINFQSHKIGETMPFVFAGRRMRCGRKGMSKLLGSLQSAIFDFKS